MLSVKQFERCPRLEELRVSYRRRSRGVVTGRSPSFTPQMTAAYLRAVWANDTIDLLEDFVMVCLNASLRPLGWVRLSRGGFDTATVDPRVVFAVALQTAAAAIVVAHNHPSGSLEPSDADKQTTRRLQEAGKLLNIRVLDHIILTREGSFSFSDHGLME